jgi:hypothetical protein
MNTRSILKAHGPYLTGNLKTIEVLGKKIPRNLHGRTKEKQAQ